MPLTEAMLRAEVHLAGFPLDRRDIVVDVIWQGILLFREYKVRSYISYTGKKIKKPGPSHNAEAGRHNQHGARTILISALCRAWLYGFEEAASLNHKNSDDTAFMFFATQVLAKEDIGKIHQHLEDYWSTRKKEWAANKKGEFPGG
jgi:hypothetical protein